VTTHRAQRNSNILKVLNVLRASTRCTISEVADRARLSRLTVAKILDLLAEGDIVTPVGKAPGKIEGGRRPQLYNFNSSARYSLGILIGEKSVTGRLVDLNIETAGVFRKSIAPDLNAAELLSVIDELIAALVDNPHIPRESILGIGVGSQGVTDFERGIVLTSPHNPSWGKELPLRDMIQKRVGVAIPVYVDNAIRFRTLAETTAGRLRNVQNSQVIHCADGLIAGNILNATIYRGVHNIAGSIGHMKINVTDTERCDCGGFGCFEMQVMPRRVLARAQSLKADFPDSVLVRNPDGALYLEELFAASESGDGLARIVMDETIAWFAIAIHNLILMYDPEVVVIQGTYAHAGDYFINSLRERVGKVSLINVAQRTTIEYSQLDDEEAGTLGAASYVLLHAFE